MSPSRIVISVSLAAVVLFAAHRAYVAVTDAPVGTSTSAETPPVRAATSRISNDAPVVHQLNLADLQSMTPKLGNPLERSDNLRAIYERFGLVVGFQVLQGELAGVECFAFFPQVRLALREGDHVVARQFKKRLAATA